MSGINDKPFRSPISNTGHSKKGPQPEGEVQATSVEQVPVRHESKSPDAIFAGLSQSGSNAQLGVLGTRVQAGLAHFPSPEKFAALEAKIRSEFPNISDSALSGVAADLLIGKVAVNA